MKEAKLPQNPYIYKTYVDGKECDAYYRAQDDMLKFFMDFLDEHIELCERDKWDVVNINALKINFKSRFMGDRIK